MAGAEWGRPKGLELKVGELQARLQGGCNPPRPQHHVLTEGGKLMPDACRLKVKFYLAKAQVGQGGLAGLGKAAAAAAAAAEPRLSCFNLH